MEAGIHDLTAGYALDALDAEERVAYEEHLAGCARCQEELASFWTVTEALAVGASGPPPPPQLRERIVGAARAERQVVVPFEARRRRLVPTLGAAAAVAAAAAIGLGLYSISLSGDLDETRSALAQQQQAAAVLADPGATTVALAAGDGRLVVARDGRAVLALSGLASPPAGSTYQAWVVRPDGPVSAGVFTASTGSTLVSLGARVAPADVVAVTIEREGGAEAPTSDPIAASQPV